MARRMRADIDPCRQIIDGYRLGRAAALWRQACSHNSIRHPTNAGMWPPLSSRAVHRERVRPKALASERPCVICLMLRRLTLGSERFVTRSRSGGKKIDKVLRARKRLPLPTRQMDVSDSERGL